MNQRRYKRNKYTGFSRIDRRKIKLMRKDRPRRIIPYRLRSGKVVFLRYIKIIKK